ncbi:hypothetical protein HU200_065780 [Digitaria exilis]|uniref:Speckle-type POZ protein n=1 Tax=Digitaria exilis TaxID=1010633 RepID=A0A834ZZM1_9POAL|nr:hypothetical protein HU200_065780 [Digitaria exilis]
MLTLGFSLTTTHTCGEVGRCILIARDKFRKPGANFTESVFREHQDTKTLGSVFIEFKLDYAETKNLAIGDSVTSEDFSAGGNLWRIFCYPRGFRTEDKGEYVSMYLHLLTGSRKVQAIFHVSYLSRNGVPSYSHEKRLVRVYSSEGSKSFGWTQLLPRNLLESNYVKDGWVTFLCNVMVVSSDTITVPPSNIGCHLGQLLDCNVTSDVSFIVEGEKFQAHRAVLAARSQVFQAELFGSMADATSSSIVLEEIEPATFRAMLVFIYTDELPEDVDLGDSPTEMMQHLLVAADRYALDRLKLLCAQKLWDIMSVDAFASTLACAEIYNCPELQSKCMDFFAVDKNFKKIVFTSGFTWLVLNFPDLAAKLKERVDI